MVTGATNNTLKRNLNNTTITIITIMTNTIYKSVFKTMTYYVHNTINRYK